MDDDQLGRLDGARQKGRTRYRGGNVKRSPACSSAPRTKYHKITSKYELCEGEFTELRANETLPVDKLLCRMLLAVN